MDQQLTLVLLVVAVGASLTAFNFFGAWAARYFSTLLFLDTVGTAIAALKYGVVAGLLVAAVSQFLIGSSSLFRQYRKFVYVTAISGIIWGAIKERYPVPVGPEVTLILYILTVGGLVGLVSTILSVPLRIVLLKNTKRTDHLLDKLDQKILEDDNNGRLAWIKIFFSELLLGHLPDRILSTTVGVFVVVVTAYPSGEQLQTLTVTYHDHIEFLAAYYYLALVFLVKGAGIKIEEDPITVLAGPLGFFSALLALPTFLGLATPFLASLAQP